MNRKTMLALGATVVIGAGAAAPVIARADSGGTGAGPSGSTPPGLWSWKGTRTG